MKVTITCDRCKKEVNGLESENFTAGFYNVSRGSCWNEYGNSGENRICDKCMWTDPRYLKDYPYVNKGV